MAHDPLNYMSGNGIPYIAAWDGSTPPEEGDWVDLGDVNRFEITPKITKKIHKSHRTGVQAIDAKVKVEESCTLKWELTELTQANLNLFFQGEISGNHVYPMEGGTTEYAIKFEQVLIRGTEYIYLFHKADITPGAALNLISDGTGEGDWGKLEFDVELLEDSTNHASNKWGDIYLAPTD